MKLFFITIFYNESEKGTTVTGMIGPKVAEIGELNMVKFISESIKHFGGVVEEK